MFTMGLYHTKMTEGEYRVTFSSKANISECFLLFIYSQEYFLDFFGPLKKIMNHAPGTVIIASYITLATVDLDTP